MVSFVVRLAVSAVALGSLVLGVGATAAATPSALPTLASAVGPVDEISVSRISGTNRYLTAEAIARQAYPGTSPIVYVVSGDDYPDALSAAPAAVAQDAPLLLTSRDALAATTRAEIARLSPRQIVVVGGRGVVSDAVVGTLRALAPSVVRVAGSDRYATSRAIARHAFGRSGADTAYVSTGSAFPDAMSAGSAAGSSGAPVILVNGAAAAADADTRALIAGLGVSAVKVTGGTGSVSAGMAASLAGAGAKVSRLAGTDRFTTSVAINANAYSRNSSAYIATGSDFPDALAGAVLAGMEPAPLFVVRTSCVPQGVLAEFDRVGVTDVVLLGGPGVLEAKVATLTSCTPPAAPGPATGLVGVFDYDRVSTNLTAVGMDRVWHREQEPRIDGVLQADRIRVVTTAPGSGTHRPPGNALRFETRPGEMTDTGGYLASRSEVLGRQANPTSTPNSQWPDPEGSTRWYGFPVYLDNPWELTTDSKWVIVTQWKGRSSGSPAIELGINKGQWRISGTGGTTTMGPARSGVWTYMQVGIHFSANSTAGWVEAWMDGRQVIPRTARATMNLMNGTADPSYLKQGIYRTTEWKSTHVMYLGTTRIGITREAVAP